MKSQKRDTALDHLDPSDKLLQLNQIS